MLSKIAPQNSPSGTNSMLNFFTGALDVAFMGSSPLVLGHLYTLPMRLVSVAARHTGSQAVLSRKGATLDAASTPRLGTVLGSDGHVLAHLFAKDRGFENPTYINLSPLECLGALASGMLDYAALWEPYVSIAIEAGAQPVFTDNDIPFNMYGFLVATERAVQHKYDTVEMCRQVHDHALEILEAEPETFLSRLRMVFGTEVSLNTYENVLTDGYDWSKVDLLNAPALPSEVLASLDGVWQAHQELQRTTFAERPFASLVGPAERSRNPDPSPLNLGYSNSIMCASFHVADFANLFATNGLEIQSGRRRIEDRIARLSTDNQDDLRLCYELLRRDPELVIQKLGHMNEQLFRTMYRDLLGSEPKSIAAVIEGLRENELVPADILSWADSVRSIRNVVTHNDQSVTDDEASNVFNIVLNILEWHLNAAGSLTPPASKCPRCKTATDPAWVACPNCGAGLTGTCKSCDRNLEPTWKVCPHCGSKQ